MRIMALAQTQDGMTKSFLQDVVLVVGAVVVVGGGGGGGGGCGGDVQCSLAQTTLRSQTNPDPKPHSLGVSRSAGSVARLGSALWRRSNKSNRVAEKPASTRPQTNDLQGVYCLQK